jgi:hypothetical protein
MKLIASFGVAILAVFAVASAAAQDSETFSGSICEIDTSVLNLTPPYLTPDGTTSVFTFDSSKLCTGVASKRNVKVQCVAPLPQYNRGDRSVKNFKCTINGDQCGISPKPTDIENAPYITTRESQLKVSGGVATLTCFYKP